MSERDPDAKESSAPEFVPGVSTWLHPEDRGVYGYDSRTPPPPDDFPRQAPVPVVQGPSPQAPIQPMAHPLPSALGPAITPEERATQIHGPRDGNPS